MNDESGTGSGTLVKTYVGGMAEIAGSNPATGAYSYYATDNLGSPRAVYSQAKALVAELDYTPYGEAYTANDTIGITHRYTGHDWDAAAALYFAPYRFYNPQLARWTSRDPLGMAGGLNVYLYATNPILFADRLGLYSDGKCDIWFPWGACPTPADCEIAEFKCLNNCDLRYAFWKSYYAEAELVASLWCNRMHSDEESRKKCRDEVQQKYDDKIDKLDDWYDDCAKRCRNCKAECNS